MPWYIFVFQMQNKMWFLVCCEVSHVVTKCDSVTLSYLLKIKITSCGSSQGHHIVTIWEQCPQRNMSELLFFLRGKISFPTDILSHSFFYRFWHLFHVVILHFIHFFVWCHPRQNGYRSCSYILVWTNGQLIVNWLVSISIRSVIKCSLLVRVDRQSVIGINSYNGLVII